VGIVYHPGLEKPYLFTSPLPDRPSLSLHLHSLRHSVLTGLRFCLDGLVDSSVLPLLEADEGRLEPEPGRDTADCGLELSAVHDSFPIRITTPGLSGAGSSPSIESRLDLDMIVIQSLVVYILVGGVS